MAASCEEAAAAAAAAAMCVWPGNGDGRKEQHHHGTSKILGKAGKGEYLDLHLGRWEVLFREGPGKEPQGP